MQIVVELKRSVRSCCLPQIPVGVRSSLNRTQDTIHVDVSASLQYETLRDSDEHQRTLLGERLKRTALGHPHVKVRLSKVVDSSRKGMELEA
jgi:hypothetical protein